jgi:hypothetical protein
MKKRITVVLFLLTSIFSAVWYFYGFRAKVPGSYVLHQSMKKDYDGKFHVGVNYPWVDYGYDFGGLGHVEDSPTNISGLCDYKEDLERDFKMFKESGITLVRIFIFCDLRNSMKNDFSDKKIFFGASVLENLDILFSTAKKNNIKLILVLFDFHMAKYDSTSSFFSDSKKSKAVIASLKKLFKEISKYKDSIYAIEPMNEPDQAFFQFIRTRNDGDRLCKFLADVAVASHETLPAIPVTLGISNRRDLMNNWYWFPHNILQYHFYSMSERYLFLPFDYPANVVSRTNPVILGEVEPVDIFNRISIAKKNGYGAILFWSHKAKDGYKIDLNEIKRWTEKNKN